MASTGLIRCSASSLVGNKGSAASNNNNNNLSSGFLPRSVSFLSPSSNPKKATSNSSSESMVVKAQDKDAHLYLPYSWLHYKPALIDSPPCVRTPWGHNVSEKEIMMSFDMPGVDASELEVMILGDELNIVFKGNKDRLDALGRKLNLGIYDSKIQLPPNCIREKAEAEFKNGILYVRLPRISVDRNVPIYVPVRAVI